MSTESKAPVAVAFPPKELQKECDDIVSRYPTRMAAALPVLRVEDGQMVAGERTAFRVEQSLQIAVLTDFCNECGNCVTFCPPSGVPYRDKPRLYLDRADFEHLRRAVTAKRYRLHGLPVVGNPGRGLARRVVTQHEREGHGCDSQES